MSKTIYRIAKYYKGNNIGTTGVVYEDLSRAERDVEMLNESAKDFGLKTVKYKVIERNE